MSELVLGVHLVDGVNYKGMGLNVMLLEGDRGWALLDTGTPGNEPVVAAYLAAQGIAPTDVKDIIATHPHPDHTGSLKALKDLTGARVLSHTDGTRYIDGTEVYPHLTRMEQAISVDPCPIDVRLRDGDVLDYLGGLRVVDAQGHTPGHFVLHATARKILFCVDLCLSMKQKLYIAPLQFNVDTPRLIREIQAVANLDFDTVLLFHGDPLLEDGPAKFRAFAASLDPSTAPDEAFELQEA